MPSSNAALRLSIPLLMLATFGTLHAATVTVRCGTNNGINSITAALKQIRNSESPIPSTINVFGACSENVFIKDELQLTIVGNNGASISDASNGTRDVIAIENSRVTISGLTVNGSANTDGIDCYDGSYFALIGNVVTGAFDGIGIYRTATGMIAGGVLQNNAGPGLIVVGEAAAVGVTIQGNSPGISVSNGGRLSLNVADPVFDPLPADTASVVTGNADGIDVGTGGEMRCGACIVRNNSGDGIHADVSATVLVAPNFNYDGAVFQAIITQNTGYGVYVGDLASATFRGSPSVGGNGQLDVVCNSPTAVTRRALAAVSGGGSTNCKN